MRPVLGGWYLGGSGAGAECVAGGMVGWAPDNARIWKLCFGL